MERIVTRYILAREQSAVNTDYKTALQERIQDGGGASPAYEMVGQSGPEHDKTFTMRVTLGSTVLGTGSGRTKKEAEQQAARAALTRMGKKQ